MIERRREFTDSEIERTLVEIGSRLDYPPTPLLAQSVRDRLLVRAAQPNPLWIGYFPFQHRLALAAAVVLLLFGCLIALLPDVRSAVAERLGLRGITITYVPSVATPTPTATSAVTPSWTEAPVPLSVRLNLGERETLGEARENVPYQILLPNLPEVGTQDEVYVQGNQVTLVYLARASLPPAHESGVGMLLTQFRGSIEPGLFGKGLGPGTSLEQVSIDGKPGFWIEGKPHLFFYRDTRGQVHSESIRLAGNTLLWEQGELTLRLESALSKDEALRIAFSVR